MKKTILILTSATFFFITLIIIYLSVFGYETEKLNSLLENKVKSNFSNTNVDLKKLKLKLMLKI